MDIPVLSDWPLSCRLFIHNEDLCVVCESSERKLGLKQQLFPSCASAYLTGGQVLHFGFESALTCFMRSKNAMST